MQRLKHLFFIFSFILIFASPAWSIDLNCSGGRWELVSSSCDNSWCMTKQYSCPTLYASIAECQLNNFVCAATSGNTKTEYWSTSATFYWCNGPQCPKAPCSNNSDAYYNGKRVYEWKCPEQQPPPSPCKDKDCGNQCPKIDVGSSASIVSGNLFHDQTLFQLPNSKPGIDFTIAYNSLDTYTGPLGKAWTHSFNINITQSGSSLTLMKQDGKRISFSYNGGIYYADAKSGEHSVIVQNSDSTYTLTEKDGTTYAFDSKGRLAQIKDRNQNTTTLTYTGDDLISITDPSVRTTTITVSGGKIAAITDPSGKVYTVTYAGNYLSAIIDPQGNTWQFTYDANGRMLTKKDPKGYTTTYTYDTNGRVTASIDPEGKIKAISYQPSANSATVTEKDGGAWTYEYDNSLNVPLKKTDPEGNTTSYTYDANKNLLSKTEADGSTTSYTYDSSGNMTTTTDALNQTTAYTYNSYGQVTSITATDNTTTTYEYDSNGNLTKTTDAAGASTSYQYDTKGNITQITNANGQTTTLSYDQYNNLISIKDPTGATITFYYDTAGNMTSQTDADGKITKFEYNPLNQLIKVIDPNGNVTTYAYDANGNKTSETDANGKTTYYEYNYKGQLLKITDALTNATKYTYGGSGCATCGGGADKLTAITDAKGQTTTYQYDTLGRLTKETDPLGSSISYSYDSKGNLTSKTDANGATISYSYDSLARLLKKSYPDNTAEAFTYDARGNILTATNQHITYYFTYDTAGRLLTVTDSAGRVLQYAYDPLGNKVKLTYPDGSVVEYNYDNANRLTSIINGGGRTYSYQYDNLGRRTKLSMPNGTYAAYSYDNSGRLISLSHNTSSGSVIDSFTYTHDKVGNRLSKTEIDTKYSYSYDAIYRLMQSLPTKLQGTDKEQEHKAESFSYDAVGNRQTGPETKDTYSYNQGNQLTEDRRHSYEYDKNGNLIRKTEKDDDGKTETWTYSYDYENRLIKVIEQKEEETKTVSFKYDPFGRRIEKKVEKTEHGQIEERKIYQYVYDGQAIILEYLTKAEDGEIKTETTRYVHGQGIDEPLSIERKKEIYYYHADGLGSIVALTDKKQKVVESYTYDSFGVMKRHGDKVKNTFTYTGREWDEEVRLYYYRARYYNPKIGRFISFDPIVHQGNGPPKRKTYPRTISYTSFDSLKTTPPKLNPFVYVQNRPTIFIDPTGEDCYSYNSIPSDLIQYVPSSAIALAKSFCIKIPLLGSCCPGIMIGVTEDRNCAPTCRKGTYLGFCEGCY